MIDPRSPSDRAEFARLLDIHGAERRRWPAERHAFFDACAGDAECAGLLADAASLDAALDLSRAPRLKGALQDSLLARFAVKRPARRPAAFRWFKMAPAGALAALSAAGFVAGSATASVEDEALYYADAAISSPIEEGNGYWPVEE